MSQDDAAPPAFVLVRQKLPAVPGESRHPMTSTTVDRLPLIPGDILLLKISGLVGWLIWFLQFINRDTSEWTHVGIVLPGGKLFEAQPGGAVISDLSAYAGRPGAIVLHYQSPVPGRPGDYELKPLAPILTDEIRRHICDRAAGMVDLGYNWDTYLYLALFRFGIRPQWLVDRIKDESRVICSQAADLVYDLENVHLFADGRMPYDVTPGDVARLQ